MAIITEEFINSLAPNQNAILNGWGLVRKGNFLSYKISPDETVIFGECAGSGAESYVTSIDLAKLENPVYRCTCPSRQFPCKHALGLMYAYAGGKSFTTAVIPEDITAKREKAEKKEEKKKEQAAAAIAGINNDAQETAVSSEASPVKKVNKAALAKKIKTQLEGLALLDKLISSILQGGLGSINEKSLRILEDQAKQLGNYYIPGAQIALREFINIIRDVKDLEQRYTRAMEQLTMMYVLSKKGKDQMSKRLDAQDMSYDSESTLDEWLGHAWQLSELKEAGLARKNRELLQLSFNSYVDSARQEYVDEGIWIELGSSEIVRTLNYRPFKAAKYIREDDSVYSVISVPELFSYPGDMNPRVRWENMTMRPVTEQDYALIKSNAAKTIKDIIKPVKKQIKNPLSDKNPVALIYYNKICMAGNNLILLDCDGQRLLLSDYTDAPEPATAALIDLLAPVVLTDQSMLVRFHNDVDAGRLYAKPLSIVSGDAVIRLAY